MLGDNDAVQPAVQSVRNQLAIQRPNAVQRKMAGMGVNRYRVVSAYLSVPSFNTAGISRGYQQGSSVLVILSCSNRLVQAWRHPLQALLRPETGNPPDPDIAGLWLFVIGYS